MFFLVSEADILFRPMSGLPLFWPFLREDVRRRAGRTLFNLAKVPARNSALQSGRLVDVFPRHHRWIVHFKDTVIDRQQRSDKSRHNGRFI